MIKFNTTPIEGTSVKLNLSFVDSVGNYYVPIVVTYTFLAMNDDATSWSIIDDLYQIPLESASTLVLGFDKLKLITGTTKQRKVLIEWTALVNGTVTDFVDEVRFEIQPKPYITNKPSHVVPTEIYVQVTDTEFQIGSSVSAPINPVMYLKTNMPVNTSQASVTIIDNDVGEEIPCTIMLDSVKTKITVVPSVKLNVDSPYTLKVEGLKNSTSSYQMKEPYTFNFVTEIGGEITLQSLKSDLDALTERVERLENPNI